MASSSGNSMEQSYYEGIPNSEVNWAQLAQNWVAMRHAGGGFGRGTHPLPPPSRSKPVGPSVEVNQPLPLPMNGSNFGHAPPPPPPPQFFVPDVGHSGAGPPPPPWIPPPPSSFPLHAAAFPPLTTPLPPWMENSVVTAQGPFPMNFCDYQAEEEEGGEYSHYYKEWDEQQKMEQRRREAEFKQVEGIPQGAMAHWMAPPDQCSSAANYWLPQGSRTQGMQQLPYIDQQTRKVLPAWIREGMEKAEKERQKKVEKETKMRAAKEAALARRAAKGLGKFDSDSSDDESSSEGQNSSNGRADDGKPVFARKTDGVGHLSEAKEQRNVTVEEVDLRSDEEKREDALVVLRRLLTEVLLETTNKEVERIVSENVEKERRKQAQPKILVESPALAALLSLGADSDEETVEGEDGKRSSDVKTDDEHIPSSGSPLLKESVGDGLLKTPLLVHPDLAPDAESKANLSSHDDEDSAVQPQGNNSNYGEKFADSYDSSSASISNHPDVAVQEDRPDFSEEDEKIEKRPRSIQEGTSKSANAIHHMRKRSRSRSNEDKTKRYSNRNSNRHRSRSKERNVRSKRKASSSPNDSSFTEWSHETWKRGRFRSKERKERAKRRSVSASSEDSEDRSSNSESPTPERYRYRHRSRTKERRSRTSRRRSPPRDTDRYRKSIERRRSRSRGRRSSHSHYKSHDEKRSRKLY